MAICEVLGYRVDIGPIKFGQKRGDEMKYLTPLIIVEKDQEWNGGSNGFFAKVTGPDEVLLIKFGGCVLGERTPLIGPAINGHRLTRHRFHWTSGNSEE